jgi:hypothetical protein
MDDLIQALRTRAFARPEAKARMTGIVVVESADNYQIVGLAGSLEEAQYILAEYIRTADTDKDLAPDWAVLVSRGPDGRWTTRTELSY